MKINVITLFPHFFDSPLSFGVISGGIENHSLNVQYVNPRAFTNDVHQTVDDRPFGGGDGMVLKTEPLQKAVESLGETRGRVVVMSPSGRPFTTAVAKEYASSKVPLTLVCGRYAGIDQRFIEQYADEELSVGDYILSGGEPAALVVIDSVARLLPGVLGNQDSPLNDSFFQGKLECPTYTRPRQSLDMEVPEVLLSGDHARIQLFQKKVSLLRTFIVRPELILESDVALLEEAKNWCMTLTAKERKTLGLGAL